MEKHPPVLIDLHTSSATVGLFEQPNYPEPWTQPSLSSFLQTACGWPVNVIFAPYAGCAMLSWTRTVDRNALVRIAPSTAYLRADVTHCRPLSYPAAGVDLINHATLTGATDGTEIKINVPSSATASFSWPANAQFSHQYTMTGSSAIISSPSASQDRQMSVSTSKSAQTEIVQTSRHLAITIWAGEQVADLLTL